MNSNEPSLTKEEIDRLSHLIENDDQFRSLLSDYVKEISDPKNRDEQEAYLNQLEQQNEIPKGKQLLKPAAGFVLKFKYTTKTSSRDKTSNYNELLSSKLFINIVYSDSVRKPTSKRHHGGESGTSWSLPYMMGPRRVEFDSRKHQVPTLDCCFHPEVLMRGAKSDTFRNLIANVAREAAMQKMKDPIEIHPQYHILKGSKYKSGDSPSFLIISSNEDGIEKELCPSQEKKTTVLPNVDSPILEKTFSRPKKDISKKSTFSRNQNILKKGFLVPPTIKDPTTDTFPEKDGGKTSEGKIIPLYEVIEKGEFELLDQMSPMIRKGTENSSPSNRPKYLEYRIYLPQAKSAKCIELDVTEKRMILKSLNGSDSNYYLSVHFPYQVLVNAGNAKFDKSSSRLTVTLSVTSSRKKDIKTEMRIY